jgi:hypothetical protein
VYLVCSVKSNPSKLSGEQQPLQQLLSNVKTANNLSLTIRVTINILLIFFIDCKEIDDNFFYEEFKKEADNLTNIVPGESLLITIP